MCLGRLPRGGRRGQKRPAVTVVAPASARISSLSSLFPPHTALQTSLLPSSLVTRTQPQAEVRVTPSAVARTVARGWPKDESELSRAGFRVPAGGPRGGAGGPRAGCGGTPRVGWEAGAEAPSRRFCEREARSARPGRWGLFLDCRT